MAHSMAQARVKRAYQKAVSARPDFTERCIRQVSAWIVLFLVLEGELGLAWDRRWHDILGRDQFWIPPHIMMYVGVGGTGLVALIVVLLDTLRYRQQKAGVDDNSTVRVLRYFHAPIGFFLLGFGTLTDLIAAPFDNYWHQLYGIDVTLWTPFHLMGVFGAIMIGLGIIYIFASEAAHEREVEHPARRLLGLSAPEWGLVLLLAGFQELVLPALTAFIPIPLGSLQLITYPFILALATSVCLVSVYLSIRKPGIALLTALVLWPMSVATETYVPLALQFMAARLGLVYRIGRAPVFNITLAMLPFLAIICALILEALVYWQRRSRSAKKNDLPGALLAGVLFAIPSVVMPPAIVYAAKTLTPMIPLPIDVIRVLQPGWLEMLITLPVTMLIGAIMAYVGTVFGDIWHWNKQ